MKRQLATLALICVLFLGSAKFAEARGFLKQSTATTVEIHLVNATTGAGITGATVTSITAFVKKHSDTSSSTKTDLTVTASGGSNDAVEVGLGDYNLELTTANTDTLGKLTLCYSYSAAVTQCDAYTVVSVNNYDALIVTASTIDDLNETDCSTIASTTSPMGRICGNKFERFVAKGTADSGSTTTVVDTERTEADNDHWNPGHVIVFTSGAIAGQARVISGFNATTDTLTFGPALTQAASTETYEIWAVGDFLRPATTGRTLVVDAAGLADANTVKVGPTGSGTAQTAGDIIGDTNDLQARVPAALGANGNMKSDLRDYLGVASPAADTAGYPKVTIKDGTGVGELNTNAGAVALVDVATLVNGLAADTINSTSVAASAVTEIQTGLLTIPKNVAYSNFTFKMFLTSNGADGTGLTPACTISKDGAAFAACTNSATEIGTTGVYKINLTQTEMNADEIWVNFTAATAREVDFKIRTLK